MIHPNIETLAEKISLHFKKKENRSYPLLVSKEQIKKELEKLVTDPDSSYIVTTS